MRRLIISVEMVRGELKIDLDESSKGEQPDEIAGVCAVIAADVAKPVGAIQIRRKYESDTADPP